MSKPTAFSTESRLATEPQTADLTPCETEPCNSTETTQHDDTLNADARRLASEAAPPRSDASLEDVLKALSGYGITHVEHAPNAEQTGSAENTARSAAGDAQLRSTAAPASSKDHALPSDQPLPNDQLSPEFSAALSAARKQAAVARASTDTSSGQTRFGLHSASNVVSNTGGRSPSAGHTPSTARPATLRPHDPAAAPPHAQPAHASQALTQPIPFNMELAPADVDFMPPLLRSLASLLRMRGKIVSAQSLLASLSGSDQITPSACMRAVATAGLRGRILHRATLQDISPLTLPCVLLLHNNRSCVLTALTQDSATALFPETGEEPRFLPLADLTGEYSGYAIFATLETRLDARTERLKLSAGKRWFWDVLKFYMPIYRHVAIASIVINMIGVLSPLFVMNVYDRVVPNSAFDTLWVLAVGIMIAYVFDFILRGLRSHFVDVAGRNADVVLSSTLVQKVLGMRLDAKPESTGALVNNLREFESLREFFSSSTLLACIDVPFLVIFLLLLGFIAGPMVFLPLAAMPLLFGAGLFLQRAAKDSAELGYKQNMNKNALLVEIVNGLETLKACMAESRMQHLWESVVGMSAKSSSESRTYNNLAITISTLITQLVTVAMVIWGVYRISEGDMTMGGLIGANILVGRAMAPLMQMASLLTRFQSSHVALKALDVLMELPSENQDQTSCIDFGILESSFTVENVSFAYPGAQRLALEDISLRIKPGEKIGVIGRMGSGKSTLGKLLIGLYQPKEGAVKFGNVDIRQLPGADLRSRVGVLPQDVVLFYGTMRDNIALGDPTINDQLILRAANLAGVLEFVRNNPAGFGAQVGEQGKSLSGGQRQAVALARALVRDPDVLILDEPTSNMDTASELMVQKRLHSITTNKTLILITHRLSMLNMIERLIVMDNGRIIMDGPRDAVLARLRGQTNTQPASPPAAPPQTAQAGHTQVHTQHNQAHAQQAHAHTAQQPGPQLGPQPAAATATDTNRTPHHVATAN